MGALTSSIGTWMQKVAQAWLIVTMTGSSSAFYLGLVIHLSLLLRWAALPAAYGIASAIKIAGYLLLFSSGMLWSGSWISNPMNLQNLVLAPLYAAAAVYLFRLNQKLILNRAGES